jgi:uncharacterized protein YbjQ (UPF0145 family)
MAISPEAIVTFDRIEGYRIVKSFGFAYGHASLPRNALRSTLRSIGAFIGFASIEYLTDAERARAECLVALIQKAEGLGANSIVGLHFQASEAPDGSTRVLAFGEAVVLDPAP